jgi:hypothetical protein
MTEITRAVAEKVRDVVDAGLVNGVGNAVPGQMCVEAAVCFALGLPHGDDPGCVAQSLRRLKIRLNDSVWSSDQARAAGLRRLAVAQLGSAGALDEKEFVRRVVEMTIRKAVPVGLRAAASVKPKHAKALEAAAVRCEQEGTREAAREGERVARAAASASAASAYAYADAYADAYAYAAADAAYAAADAYAAAASASAAADAYAASASAASASAYAYADAADAAAAAAAYAARTRDRVLAQYAEWVVEILIDMNAPGCQWLDLTPKQEAA